MKRLIFVVTVLLLTIAMPAAAQSPAPSTKIEPPGGCVVDFSTGGCFTDGSPTTAAGTTTTTACVKKTSYSTCLKNCKCEYDKAAKECKNKATCLQLAKAEKDACDGGCLSDFVP